MKTYLYIFIIMIIVPGIWQSLPGEVHPLNVQIAFGDSVNITCTMNLKMFGGKNSSDMYFVNNDNEERVPTSNIAIIDDSTIVLMLRNASVPRTNYRCDCDGKAINIALVEVGTPPVRVNDFECYSHNFEYMECTFTKPENAILTQYYLQYFVVNSNYKHNCVLTWQGADRLFCNITGNNYRSCYNYFNFTLNATNVLGTINQNFLIDHFESVILARPEFEMKAITESSATLSWNMNVNSCSSKSTEYEVYLCPAHFACNYQSKFNVSRNKSEYNITLLNLPYAYYNYTVRLRVKTMTTRADERLWSKPYERHFRTAAMLPSAPPTTDIGSFYINAAETSVCIYWQQLPVTHHNGPNFHYEVVEVKRNDRVINLRPISGVFDDVSIEFPWQKEYSYEFAIVSKNDVGASAATRLRIPRIVDVAATMPLRPRTVSHNGMYTFSWSAPHKLDNLVDYTVFWCTKKVNVKECKESIQFKHVPKERNSLEIESKTHEHIFAISANYGNYTSGMHWSKCSAEDDSELINMDPEITPLPRGNIRLQWSTDMICDSVLEGYRLNYCAVDEAPNCLPGTEGSVNIGMAEKQYIITGLQAYTTYKIEMYMYSQLKKGPVKAAKYVQTSEDAPMPPRELKHYNITSNSGWISWLPPAKLNGILKHYTVVVNNEHHTINCSQSICPKDPHEEMTYHLENLSSYTNYKVYVRAHTVSASAPSNDIHFRTLIGIPSNPRHFNEPERNVLQWMPPEMASGRVEFYEVSITMWYQNEKRRESITPVLSTNCCITIPPCEDAHYTYTLRVRAVNVAALDSEVDYQLYNPSVGSIEANDLTPRAQYNHDYLQCVAYNNMSLSKQLAKIATYTDSKRYLLYKSVWEKGPTYGCAAPKDFVASIVVLVVCMIVFMPALIILSRYVFIKWRKMLDIDCTLPDGMINVLQTNGRNGFDKLDCDLLQRDLLLRSDYHVENSSLLSGSVTPQPNFDNFDMEPSLNDLKDPPRLHREIAADDPYVEIKHRSDEISAFAESQNEQSPVDTDGVQNDEEMTSAALPSPKPDDTLYIATYCPMGDIFRRPGGTQLLPQNDNGYINSAHTLRNLHSDIAAAAAAKSEPLSDSSTVSTPLTPQLFNGYVRADFMQKVANGDLHKSNLTTPMPAQIAAASPTDTIGPPAAYAGADNYVTQKTISMFLQNRINYNDENNKLQH